MKCKILGTNKSSSTLYLIKEQDDKLVRHDVNFLILEAGKVFVKWITEN